MRHGIDPSDYVVPLTIHVDSTAEDAGETSSPTDDGLFSLGTLLPNCRFLGGKDLRFSSIAESADTATEGQLVVYRIGKDCPARLVADAMARGAAGILTEQMLPCPLPQCIVGDIDLAQARLTAEQLDRPDRKLLTVGVIGSAGKTSTTLLISSLLRNSGIRTAFQSDLGDCDGIVQSTSNESMPSGASLVEWIGEANDCECRAAIIEISDDDARHGQYDAIEFDLLVVTGTASCDGDFGPSSLQCMLERMTRDGVVIAPAEDAKALRVIRDSGTSLLTYGVRKRADVTAKIIDQSGGMTTLLMTHHDTSAVMETALCGPAMAANHAAATLVGLLIAQPLEEIVEKLSQLRSIPGRGQRLESFGHATVVLDAGVSPASIASALRTVHSMKSPGRLWTVLAIDDNQTPEMLAEYGNLMERFSDHPIVTSANQASSFLKASHCILDGVQQCAAFRLVANPQRALRWAVTQAEPSDTILFLNGRGGASAAEQRQQIERISRWVEQAREEEPIQLKVVG